MVEDVQEVRGRACINGQKESPETTRVSASVFRSLHAPACVRGGLTDHYHQPPLTARLARDAGGVAPPPPPAAAELKPEYEEADTSLPAYRPPPPPPPPPVVSSVSVARGAGEGGRDCEEEGQVAGSVMTWRASEGVRRLIFWPRRGDLEGVGSGEWAARRWASHTSSTVEWICMGLSPTCPARRRASRSCRLARIRSVDCVVCTASLLWTQASRVSETSSSGSTCSI